MVMPGSTAVLAGGAPLTSYGLRQRGLSASLRASYRTRRVKGHKGLEADAFDPFETKPQNSACVAGKPEHDARGAIPPDDDGTGGKLGQDRAW